MNFFIKQNSTLPFIQIEIFDDGRSGFRNALSTLTATTISFSMYNEDTGIYKIIDSPAQIVTYDSPSGGKTYAIRYQFSKRDTSKHGSFIGEFKILNRYGDIILPITNNIEINIIESFADADFCCRPNKGRIPFVTPTPLPNDCELIVVGEVTDNCDLIAVGFINDDCQLVLTGFYSGIPDVTPTISPTL